MGSEDHRAKVHRSAAVHAGRRTHRRWAEARVRLALCDCRGGLLSCEGLCCGIAWRAPAPHRRELREAFVRDAEQSLHEARRREQHLLHGITGLEEERVRGPEVEKLFSGGKD